MSPCGRARRAHAWPVVSSQEAIAACATPSSMYLLPLPIPDAIIPSYNVILLLVLLRHSQIRDAYLVALSGLLNASGDRLSAPVVASVAEILKACAKIAGACWRPLYCACASAVRPAVSASGAFFGAPAVASVAEVLKACVVNRIRHSRCSA